MPASESPKSETPTNAIPEAPDGFVEVYKCPECNETNESKDDFETEPKYECGNCGEEFPASEGESRGFAQNGCPSCGKYASNVGRVHRDCGGDPEEFTSGFKCEECEEVVESVDDAKAHLTDAHPADDEDDEADALDLIAEGKVSTVRFVVADARPSSWGEVAA